VTGRTREIDKILAACVRHVDRCVGAQVAKVVAARGLELPGGARAAPGDGLHPPLPSRSTDVHTPVETWLTSPSLSLPGGV
jgi:hypothetical protein